MKIITLVENTSDGAFRSVHGLSFYIETKEHKILFDLGPDSTVFENAKKKNIDLGSVDTVIISHGHNDHGGALKEFLELNNHAKIYVQRSAFDKYYAKVLFLKIRIGLDASLKDNPNVILVDGNYKIDSELYLFTADTKGRFRSEANDNLYSTDGKDAFSHEQSLLITENKNVLIMGCGHSGVVNILEKLDAHPDYCLGGFHLYNPANKKTVSDSQLSFVSDELTAYDDVAFYTCHCTGQKAFDYLSFEHKNIKYIACGDELDI